MVNHIAFGSAYHTFICIVVGGVERLEDDPRRAAPQLIAQRVLGLHGVRAGQQRAAGAKALPVHDLMPHRGAAREAQRKAAVTTGYRPSGEQVGSLAAGDAVQVAEIRTGVTGARRARVGRRGRGRCWQRPLTVWQADSM